MDGRFDRMTQAELKAMLESCDEKYDRGESGIPDIEYDYAKRLYNQRRLRTADKGQTLMSISSPTGVGIKRERNTKLPVPLRSLDNMFFGEGDVEKFKVGGAGYYLSAKMDGISGLYSNGVLYTRGDAITGRDISHILPLIKTAIPKIRNYAVRGELVMNKHVFARLFHGQAGRSNARNAVSGALGAIHNIDVPFINEIEFIAYEIIGEPILAPSAQFQTLVRDGWKTARGQQVDQISDETLAAYYQELLLEYEYEIDGVVVTHDRGYTREEGKNPLYSRAFKQALECLMAPSKVVHIEWNVSSYGYLIPTVIYEPVVICGVTLARATGESARYIVEQGLGPGAEVEIIYHGKVNPRIHQVFQPVQPALPPADSWEWIPRPNGDPIHIRAIGGSTRDQVEILTLTRFLTELNVKNVGEGLVKRLYENGITTVKRLLTMKPAEIAFMGPKTAENIPAGIQKAVQGATMVTWMTCSGAFGRGFGDKKFARLLDAHPDYTQWTLERILTVEGFAEKTAKLILTGLPVFLAFLREHGINSPQPVDIPALDIGIPVPALGIPVAAPAAMDMPNMICMTGFRDTEIQAIISARKATLQSTCNKSTKLVLVNDLAYTNKKIETAKNTGIPIMTGDEFKNRYSIK